MCALKNNNTNSTKENNDNKREMLKNHGTSKPASNGSRAATSLPLPPK